MTDQEFIDAFAAGRLDPAGFDHRAHLRAAFLLYERGLLDGWYSKERLASGAARARFTMPDRMGGTHG